MEQDLPEIAKDINELIRLIGQTRREIEDKGKAKAKAISDYDRKLAVTIAVLRDKETYTLGERTFNSPPATLTEKIAKGICADERYAMEVADSGYKACISNLNALMAQLNAKQSIFRHYDINIGDKR